MLWAQLVESLVDVENGNVSDVGEGQVHAAHHHQVERTQSQVAMEQQLAKELHIAPQAIATHCVQLLLISQEVVRLQKATGKFFVIKWISKIL